MEVYIEWVLDGEPHHLPPQSTKSTVDRAPLARRHTYIYIYIYVQSRPLSLPPPRAQGPPRHRRLRAPKPNQPGRWRPPGPRLLARRTGPRRHPFSLIPFPSRRLPSVHLSLPTGECSGPTETGAQSLSPLRQGGNALVPGPRSPSEPTPTTRSIPLAHRASRQRAMPCWMDGRLGGPGPCSVARCQATVTLPLRCATTPTTERPA